MYYTEPHSDHQRGQTHGTRRNDGSVRENQQGKERLSGETGELEPAPMDAKEAKCPNCPDGITYVHPDTEQPYDRPYGPKPKFCPDCGRRTKPNPAKRKDLICETCKNSGDKKALLVSNMSLYLQT